MGMRAATRREAGFSVIEVLIASTIFAIGLTAAMRLFAAAATANAAARIVTDETILAVDKMEQLRAYNQNDVAMQRSPPDTLSADTDGFFDRARPPFVRRWSIEPLPGFEDDGVVVRVVVLRDGSPARVGLETIRVWKPVGAPPPETAPVE